MDGRDAAAARHPRHQPRHHPGLADTRQHREVRLLFVKLRERERHRVDQGQGKKKEKKWMVDGGYPFPDALH